MNAFSRRVLAALSALVLLSSLAAAGSVQAAGATLSFATSKRSVAIGETFTVTALINTGGTSINAATAAISFDPAKLTAVSISRSGSVFTLWAEEPSLSNSRGLVTGSGGLPTPGFSGNAGTMMRITFRATAVGSTTIRYASGELLANDGQGTNILAGLDTVAVSIGSAPVTPAPTPVTPTPPGQPPAAPVLTSLTHPNADTWYNIARPVLVWELPPDVDGVSVVMNDKPDTDPGTISAGLFNFYTAPFPLADGLWYGHVRLKNRYGWGPVSHRLFKVDATAPVISEAKILSQGPDQRTLEFTATDAASGVLRVAVNVDGAPLATQATSPYTLPTLTAGDHIVELIAYDQAGNHNATQLFVSVVAAPLTPTSLLNPLTIGLIMLNVLMTLIITIFEFRHHRDRQELRSLMKKHLFSKHRDD